MKEQIDQKLSQILSQNQIRRMEPLELHTSLHIGGNADYFVMPSEIGEIIEIIRFCKEVQMPYDIIGNGSNLLVSDQGFRGLLIHLGEMFAQARVSEDGTVKARAGILLSKLASIIADHSLTGFEFASGIPGSLGGAVTMNAGAYDGEIKQCIVSATLLDPHGNVLLLSRDELKLGYRHSILQEEEYILIEAVLQFDKGDETRIRSRMQELNRQRREKQPLDQYSAGSTFKRPAGNYASKLINDAGLRGYQVGGAAVSEKHCGFLINKDHATANDFNALIRDVIHIIQEKYGITLEPEVKFLGEF